MRHLEISGFFASREEMQECLRRITALMPPEIDKRSDKAIVTFWSNASTRGSRGLHRQSKTIETPAWESIAANYPSAVRCELQRLMCFRTPGNLIARLMLWRGLPGTGKTWAIRALAREWTNWCNFHYVIDPGQFFRDTAYMLRLLSDLDAFASDDDRAEPKWNVLVLEDAGEFIALDARQQDGQALAKLLNLSDGMLGQGLKLMVLITTNEESRNLHPAITRDGRCLTNLEFVEFSESEAREWLARHGGKRCAPPRRLSLSDLYAAASDFSSIVNSGASRVVGFTARRA